MHHCLDMAADTCSQLHVNLLHYQGAAQCFPSAHSGIMSTSNCGLRPWPHMCGLTVGLHGCRERNGRMAAEASSAMAEAAKAQAETAMTVAKAAKVQAETASAAAMSAKEKAEMDKLQAEHNTCSAQQARATAVAAQAAADAARHQAEEAMKQEAAKVVQLRQSYAERSRPCSQLWPMPRHRLSWLPSMKLPLGTLF